MKFFIMTTNFKSLPHTWCWILVWVMKFRHTYFMLEEVKSSNLNLELFLEDMLSCVNP